MQGSLKEWAMINIKFFAKLIRSTHLYISMALKRSKHAIPVYVKLF